MQVKEARKEEQKWMAGAEAKKKTVMQAAIEISKYSSICHDRGQQRKQNTHHSYQTGQFDRPQETGQEGLLRQPVFNRAAKDKNTELEHI